MSKDAKNIFSLPRMRKFARVPEEERKAVAEIEKLPPVRGMDGRTLRRTGRDVFFGTNIRPALKDWLKAEAVRKKMPIGALLDQMQIDYQEAEKKRKG
jgi:hypothetical protein